MQLPVIAFGAGTSLEGSLCPIHGGICLGLRQMNQFLDVSPNDFFVTVQCGKRRKQPGSIFLG